VTRVFPRFRVTEPEEPPPVNPVPATISVIGEAEPPTKPINCSPVGGAPVKVIWLVVELKVKA
jgi:hypothetical protein